MAVYTTSKTYHTKAHMGMIDITNDFRKAVNDACREKGISSGIITGFTTGGVAGLTTLEFEPGMVYYINVLTQITALCDCWGMTTPSLVPDIGIMASDDIVAIERASIDAIKMENLIKEGVPAGMELSGEGHLFQQLHGKNPYVQLDKLEEVGLGTQDYELVTVK